MSLFKRRSAESERWIVVGLGNPGEHYAGTRHNAGALVVEQLATRAAATFKRHKSGCLVAEADIAGYRVVLARPMSYMNESGRPLRDLAAFYKIPPDHIVVVHDELDIPFGEIRIKDGGGTAGHNGLGSIVNHLKSRDFVRVRVGISRPGAAGAADHVLDRFTASERKEWPDILMRAADAVERYFEVGIERAMNEVNTRT
jgi:peptidyl-tRNA hydrolase, PTH1 family